MGAILLLVWIEKAEWMTEDDMVVKYIRKAQSRSFLVVGFLSRTCHDYCISWQVPYYL